MVSVSLDGIPPGQAEIVDRTSIIMPLLEMDG